MSLPHPDPHSFYSFFPSQEFLSPQTLILYYN